MLMIIPKFLNYTIQVTLLKLTSCFIRVSIKCAPFLIKILKFEFKKVDVLIFHRFKQTLLRRHWDMQINDHAAYGAIAGGLSVGLGDGYVKGWWESPNLQETLYRIVKGNMDAHTLQRWAHNVTLAKHQVFNYHTPKIAKLVGKTFFDQHLTVFKIMLDPSMTYSCAYWAGGARTLEEAQAQKMELIARKLKLKPGMRVLDLGCGYGGLMKYLAQTQKVAAVGCTVSAEEAKFARESCAAAGLDNVDIQTCDYRELLKKAIKAGESFDRVVCIGMLEHVGHENYREFFKLAQKALKEEGLLLIETVGQSEPVMPLIDPWICKNLIQNFVLPYHTMLPEAADGLFVLEDWQNLGVHFLRTLNAWINNFHLEYNTVKHKIENAEEFNRKWSYFLQTGASAFRARKLQCWQIVFSKGALEEGYDASR